VDRKGQFTSQKARRNGAQLPLYTRNQPLANIAQQKAALIYSPIHSSCLALLDPFSWTEKNEQKNDKPFKTNIQTSPIWFYLKQEMLKVGMV
jgi:hypothetical protein